MAFCTLSSGVGDGSIDERVNRLSVKHHNWLEEEVVYIITEREQETFLSLETLEERNHFIKAFWRRRDPNGATPVNEFREEHYRRFEYANKFFGRDTFREGWRTDRGRYYIILGKPRDVSRFNGYSELVDSELWFYQGDVKRGIPSFFYLLFFKKHGAGESELYSPIIDGPKALLRGPAFVSGADNFAALDKLREISPELANASLSFDTSEPPDFINGRAALGTPTMLARIAEYPKRAIDTNYADAWALYGDRVSAEYSFNYVPSRSVFSVLVGPEATPFVHYAIEIDPQHFTLESDEDQTKFYTTLDVTVEVADLDETLVISYDRESYLELNAVQLEEVKGSSFSYQDDFPLISGDYTVSIVLRNHVRKQYTVAEVTLNVPDYSEGNPALADVVLGYTTEVVATLRPSEFRAFQVGPIRVQPAADGLFAIGDTVHAVTQIVQAPEDYRVTFDLLQSLELLDHTETTVAESDGLAVVADLSLFQVTGGTYQVRARLITPDGNTVSERVTELNVSPRSFIPRSSFLLRRGFNSAVPGILSLARGEQLWNRRRFEEAQVELEKAVGANNPRIPSARWKLAQAYLHKARVDEAYQLLAPMEQQFSEVYEVVAGLGYVFYYKEQDDKAIGYLERARSIRPPDTILLNSLGNSYFRLGNIEKARETFERSLEMNHDQPEIREQLSTLTSGAGL